MKNYEGLMNKFIIEYVDQNIPEELNFSDIKTEMDNPKMKDYIQKRFMEELVADYKHDDL